MASTFSPSLRIQLIGTGDQSGVWGQTTNNNLGSLIEQAITGVETITMVNTDYVLTNFNGISDEARNAILIVEGTNSAVRKVVAPLENKIYVVKNATINGFAINIGGTTGAVVSVPNGVTTTVYCDGTDFYEGLNGATSNFAVTNNLTVGGTTTLTGALGGSTAVFSGAVSSVSPTFTGTPTAPTATVTTDNTQIATTAFVRDIIPTGIISMWSGSIATIPSGWLICDGTNGTPDLRNRFIVGAGSTYAVADTGGSADAVVVSHTHTATSVVTDPGHVHPPLAPATSFSGPPNSSQGLRADAAQSTNMATTGSAVTGVTVATTNSTEGVSGTNANLPPYYALAYIMKS